MKNNIFSNEDYNRMEMMTFDPAKISEIIEVVVSLYSGFVERGMTPEQAIDMTKFLLTVGSLMRGREQKD